MSMKPILFSTPMVQAILDGRKTMTRRVVKPQPTHGIRVCGYSQYGWSETKENGDCHCHNPGWHPYQVDDVLWVRETWRKTGTIATPYAYRADEEPFVLLGEASDVMHLKYRYKPSIFMPREAARIFLRVTDVRVERLQEITEADALAEGVEGVPCDHAGRYACEDCMNTGWIEPPSVNFMTLWDSINAKRGYSWESNPWVWVYTFERVEP